MTGILGRLRIHASKISKTKLSHFSLLFSIAQGSGHRALRLCQDTQQLQLLKHLSALNDNSLITIDQVNNICRSDGVYQKFVKAIINGFPKTRSITDPEIQENWKVRNRLSLFMDIVLLDDRIVIPQALRKQILHSLHSAHQGCTGMKARANQCVYWPGMSKSISSYKANCATCIINTPVSRESH